MSSIYKLRLNIDPEYIPIINDMMRMFVIQFVVNFMFYVSNPISNPLFNETFLETLLYILLGVMTYWLIVKKLIDIDNQ
jgi:hypothetical protein